MLLKEFIEDLDLPTYISLPFSEYEKSLNITHSDINIIIRVLEDTDCTPSDYLTQEESDELRVLLSAKSKCSETKSELELHKE